MSHASAAQPVRRLVLVPATATGRGDELIRRYRLARLRDLASPQHPQARASVTPPAGARAAT